MHDVRRIVQEPEEFARQMARRGADASQDVERIAALEKQRKEVILELDSARNMRKSVSTAIGERKRPPTETEKEEMRTLGGKIAAFEEQQRATEAELNSLALSLPNIALQDVPDGADSTANVLLRGAEPPKDEGGKPHWEIAEELGLYDLKASANISGARFALFKGAGARLHRALANWMLDTNIAEGGYTEVEPPALVRRETMVGSGNLPKFEDNLYHDDETDLWLIPTSEVALNGMHAGEVLPAGTLPLKYVSCTPCFRKEKTAGGRDIRGVKRVHQFTKVEMFRVEEPQNALAAQEEMVAAVEHLCAELGLLTRVLLLCAGDMGFQAARTLDVEVWAPGSKEWLEVSSVSTCGEFQARRSGIRYRETAEAKPAFPHTLNGSALALPRIWAALLESGYSAQSSTVDVPPPLRRYTGFNRIEK